MTTDPYTELAKKCKADYEALTPKGQIAVAYAVAELTKIIEARRAEERALVTKEMHK